LAIGLLMQAMYLMMANRFLDILYFFLGLLQGLAICFIIAGILPKNLYFKLKGWKVSAANNMPHFLCNLW